MPENTGGIEVNIRGIRIRTEGVGWVTQIQLSNEDQWYSWTQWKDKANAVTQATKLLERDDVARSRVVRVDWTVVEEFEQVSAEEQAHLEEGFAASDQAGGGRKKRDLDAEGET